MRPVRARVLWKELGAEWQLDPELYELMDQREGVRCPFCGSNWRVRHLATVLLADIADHALITTSSVVGLAKWERAHSLRIAEINTVAGLHASLARLSKLQLSEYGSTEPDVPHEDLTQLPYESERFD
jgi:hypothetical protein